LAAKPLPATSQPAAPFPVGRSFGYNLILPNSCGVITNKTGVINYPISPLPGELCSGLTE